MPLFDFFQSSETSEKHNYLQKFEGSIISAGQISNNILTVFFANGTPKSVLENSNKPQTCQKGQKTSKITEAFYGNIDNAKFFKSLEKYHPKHHQGFIQKRDDLHNSIHEVDPSLEDNVHFHFLQDEEIDEKNLKCLLDQLPFSKEQKEKFTASYKQHRKEVEKTYQNIKESIAAGSTIFLKTYMTAVMSGLLQLYIKPYLIDTRGKKFAEATAALAELAGTIVTWFIDYPQAFTLANLMTTALAKLISYCQGFLLEKLGLSSGINQIITNTLLGAILGYSAIEDLQNKLASYSLAGITGAAATCGYLNAAVIVSLLPKLAKTEEKQENIESSVVDPGNTGPFIMHQN